MRPKLAYVVGSQEEGENEHNLMNDIKDEDDIRLNETLLQLENDSFKAPVLAG